MMRRILPRFQSKNIDNPAIKNYKGPCTISRGFWPKSNSKFILFFSVSLKDFKIYGEKKNFVSPLSANIFMYRFSCISGLKSKKSVFRRDKNYTYSIFHEKFEKNKKFGLGPTLKTQKFIFSILHMHFLYLIIYNKSYQKYFTKFQLMLNSFDTKKFNTKFFL